MSAGLFFVIDPNATHEDINRFIRHNEECTPDGLSGFKLVTTKNAYDLEDSSGEFCLDPTPPSLNSTLDNSWAGATLADVEAFCLDLASSSDDPNSLSKGPGANLFVVVDADGFRDQNAILAELSLNMEEDVAFWMKPATKIRLPWDDIYMSYIGLEVSNIDFDELGEKMEDDGEGIWYEPWPIYLEGSEEEVDAKV